MSDACPVCDLQLAAGRRCPNYWCGRPDRGFDVVWAVGPFTPELRRAITGLKYRGDRRWVVPLAQRLARYLVERAPCFDDVDLIVATPGTVGASRPVDHAREILGAARPWIGRLWSIEDGAVPVLAKRWPTRRLVDAPSAAVRRLWAAGELRASLTVVDPASVRGARVLVFDDVFTDGSTMREVAGALRAAGAHAVSGLVLARVALTRSPATRPQGPETPLVPSARYPGESW